jgi:undecaprenyl-diphosphatase
VRRRPNDDPSKLWRTALAWDRALTARLTLPPAPAGHQPCAQAPASVRTRANPETTRNWRRLAMMIAHSGDSGLWLAGATLAYTWGHGSWREVARRVFLSTFAGGAVTWLLKLLFRRRRPSSESQGLHLRLDVHSFPSGHAGRNACSVVSLWPLLPSPLRMGSLLWLILLGLSRVALGIHYVSDVLAGFIVGGGLGWGMRRMGRLTGSTKR